MRLYMSKNERLWKETYWSLADPNKDKIILPNHYPLM